VLAAFGVSVSGLLQPVSKPRPSEEVLPATAAIAPLAEPAAPVATPAPVTLNSDVAARTPAPPPAVAESGPAKPAAGSAVEPEPVRSVTKIAKEAIALEAEPSSAANEPPSDVEAVPTPPAGETPRLPTPETAQPTLVPEASAADLALAASAQDAPGQAPAIGSDTPAEAPMLAVKAISLEQPEFPTAARMSGIEGWVTVSYTIDAKGRVSDVHIVDAQPRRVFDSAVRKAVHNWRFEPSVVEGEPVARRMTQTIQFSLDYKMICSADPATGTRLIDRCRTKDEIERQGTASGSAE
jgi:periplasmic protein TonB